MTEKEIKDNLLEVKRAFIQKELEQALVFLQIPIMGYTLYKLKKLLFL